MSSIYHTPIPYNTIADDDTFNDPMSQLDLAIDDHWTFTSAHETELVAARGSHASLDARLDIIEDISIVAGGNVVTTANGSASAGQKTVTVISTSGFVAGASVEYLLNETTLEYNTIDIVTDATHLLLDNNIGTGGILSGGLVALISTGIPMAANAIHHGSADLTLPRAMEYAASGVFNVMAYGASPSASAAVNTAAIQAAINALAIEDAGATGDYAGTVLVPPGAFEVEDTLVFQSLRGFKLSGTGGASRLVWTANDPTKAIIDILDCRNSTIENLTITVTGGSGAGALACIRVAGTAADGAPTHNHFSDLFLDYGLHAVYIGGTSSTDANNDFMQFTNCEFHNYTTSGVYMSGQSQAYNYLFHNCSWFAGSGADYAVDGGTGVIGGFTVSGGATWGHDVAAFRLARSPQPFLIENHNEEGNAKFVVASVAHTQLTIRGCRLSCSSVNVGDLTLIDFGATNSILTIEDCYIGDGQTPTVALKVADVRFGSAANAVAYGRFVFNRNTVFSTLDGTTNDDWPFETSDSGNTLPTHAEGNLVVTDISTMATVRLEPARRATEFLTNDFMHYHGGAKVIRARTTGAVIDYSTFNNVLPYHIFTVICDGGNTFYNHNTATYGDNLYLSGNADVTMTDGSSITFYYDFDNDRFIEISRSVH